VVDHLRRLEKRVSSVQPGEFYAELDDDGKDEISTLTGRVNEMFTKLHDYSTELEVQKEHLEFEVHRRTESLLQLNSVLANALDGIIHTSDRGEIVSMNQVAGRLLDPLTIGDRICTNLDEQSREAMSYGFAILYRKDRVELNLTSKTGRSFDAVLIPERDTAGDVISVHVFLQDVTERDALLRTVEHQAEHDDLTGLPNRRKFLNHLQNLMDDDVNVGLAFVDLDNFKYFNDSLGHSVGDSLLNEIARRLSRLAGQNGFVARLGGDEFILIFQNPDMEVVDQLAREVVEAVKEPIRAEGRELYATCSVGLAGRREDSDAESLLRDADIAMYQAKQNGKADYAIFDQSMNDRVVERMELETGLRVALEREEIFLVYQPIMELGSRIFSGVEALIRWKHPELGMIPPDKFIPIAEETGLILSLGRFALRTACQKAAEWNQLSRDPIGVQVNLSQRQIQTGGFAKVVEETLKETGLKPQFLTLEITESLAVADVSLAIRMLQELRDLGVKIAIDD
jgi:diguanylate cyclase (GGDEF)-like protein